MQQAPPEVHHNYQKFIKTWAVHFEVYLPEFPPIWPLPCIGGSRFHQSSHNMLTLPSISSNNSELSRCYDNTQTWEDASWKDDFYHVTLLNEKAPNFKTVLYQDFENMSGVFLLFLTFLNQSKIRIFSFHFWGKAAGKTDLFCQRTVVAQPLMSACHYAPAFKYWSLTSSVFKCNNNRKKTKQTKSLIEKKNAVITGQKDKQDIIALALRTNNI